jgi:hypothetical protein
MHNPFYSIRFNLDRRGGADGIKNGQWGIFSYTLRRRDVVALRTVTVEAKARNIRGRATFECDFRSSSGCGPISNNGFTWWFLGATNNGHGTTTLTFKLQNNNVFGLDHADFALPPGVVPVAPSAGGTYTIDVCLDETQPEVGPGQNTFPAYISSQSTIVRRCYVI